MFWGLIMEPGKKYSQTVEKSFHVSQAALDLDTAQNECVQVLLGFESRNYLLCTLQRNKWVQSNLDLNFQAGDCVSFATNGPGHVHLTGYLVPEDDYDYMDEDEEEDDEQVPVLVDMPSKKRKASDGVKKEQAGKPIKKSKTELLLEQYGEADSDDSDDSDVNTDVLGEESDVEEEAGSDDEDDVEDEDEGSSDEPLVNISAKGSKGESPTKQVAKNQKGVSPGKQAAKNQKGESPKSPKGESPKQNGVAKTPKSEKKLQKQEKTPKNDKQQKLDKTPKSEIPPKSPTSSGKKAGGVIIEELKVGEGQQAKPGKFATVYYEGRLKTNNKVFDSSVKGPGFKFRLGKQEVIKGWDVGVSGMKVGGKRRITCPPHMAYGAQGSPPVIPPNSTLVFEVELKKVT